MLSRFLIPLFLSCAASVATAQQNEYESQTLFSKGAWEVEITYNTVAKNVWCSASTYNRFAQSFNIVAYDSGGLGLFVFDDSWDLKPRPVNFIVDIDYSRWTISGQASDTGVSANLTDIEKTKKFLGELQRGSAVAIYNEKVQKLSTFSLNGSSAALLSLMDCWNKIAKPSDPFEDNSDPFGASSDPF